VATEDRFSDGVVPIGKIEQYLLNDDHADGGPKSVFFKRFGFAAEDGERLERALVQHPVRNGVCERPASAYGEKLLVRCALETPDGRNPCILTVWMKRPGDLAPRLVTAYPA